MSRVRRSITSCRLLASLVAIVALLALGCEEGGGAEKGAAKKPSGPPAPVVGVQKLEPRSIAHEVQLLGQLDADEVVRVRSEIDGVIESVHFTEGDPVEKGQILFQLRDAEQRARLREARASLALAADANRRAIELSHREAISSADLDRARADYEEAQARVELAEVELARTKIRAPFNGLAGTRLVSPGASIEHDTDLVEIQAIDTLKLAFTLPEQALPVVRVGLPFELTVAPYPGVKFPGEITFVAPGLNPANRRVLVKGRVPNPDHRLRPGLFARVDARIAQRDAALVVPEEAVVIGTQGPFVWRVGADDKVERVGVELGIREPGQVEIRQGLAAGDVVVVAGTHKLSPGQHVEARSEPPIARSGKSDGDDGSS